MAETPTTPDLGATPPPPEFRFADTADVLPELRGKTAREAMEVFAAYQASGMVPAAQAPPPPAPAPTPPPPSNGGYASVTDLHQLAAQQASVTLTLAQREHGEAFKRWGREIAEVLQRVPQSQWTLEAIQNAVFLVKGRHADEYAAERVRALESTPFGTMRSSGGNGWGHYAPPKPEAVTEQAIAGWQQRAASAGITDAHVKAFCDANDMEPGEFWAQFRDGVVGDAVADIGNGKKRG